MEDKNFNIDITNKVAIVRGSPCIVCGNSDYTITFTFNDAEWSEYEMKTARFVFIRHGEIKYDEVVFTGNAVSVPALFDITEVLIGVYAGELYTTTPAVIKCKQSILCRPATNEKQTQTAYRQLLAFLRDIDGKLDKVGINIGESFIVADGLIGSLGIASFKEDDV